MNITLLTRGLGNKLIVQHLTHRVGSGRPPAERLVHLLILDSRGMDTDCFQSACTQVRAIRKELGLNHGVILSATPTLPLVVAAIRSGLRDIIYQYINAAHLRQLLQAANPGARLTVAELDAFAALLRTVSGVSMTDGSASDLARREHELARRAEQLANAETRLAGERESVDSRDRELRERTRRLDRQFAMMQNDADVTVPPFPVSSPPFPEHQAMSRKLDQRAAELDLREKLLREMETLLLANAAAPGR